MFVDNLNGLLEILQCLDILITISNCSLPFDACVQVLPRYFAKVSLVPSLALYCLNCQVLYAQPLSPLVDAWIELLFENNALSIIVWIMQGRIESFLLSDWINLDLPSGACCRLMFWIENRDGTFSWHDLILRHDVSLFQPRSLAYPVI